MPKSVLDIIERLASGEVLRTTARQLDHDTIGTGINIHRVAIAAQATVGGPGVVLRAVLDVETTQIAASQPFVGRQVFGDGIVAVDPDAPLQGMRQQLPFARVFGPDSDADAPRKRRQSQPLDTPQSRGDQGIGCWSLDG